MTQYIFFLILHVSFRPSRFSFQRTCLSHVICNMLRLQELQVALVLATIESNSSVLIFSTKFILLNNFALPVRYSNNLSDIYRRNELLDFFSFFLMFLLDLTTQNCWYNSSKENHFTNFFQIRKLSYPNFQYMQWLHLRFTHYLCTFLIF